MPDASFRFRIIGSFGYLLMLVPTLLAVWVQRAYIPMLRRGMIEMLKGVALPELTNSMLNFGPWLWCFPVLIFVMAVASIRFHVLHHPTLVGLIGSGLATFFLIFGVALTLPFITLTDRIGEARPAASDQR